jgi:BON domain
MIKPFKAVIKLNARDSKPDWTPYELKRAPAAASNVEHSTQNMRNAAISIALVTAFLVVSIACSKRPSDDVIAKDIQSKIAADPATKDSDVQVTAKDGKVTLSGKAKSPAAQQRAEQIAREEPGTTGLDDETSLEPELVPPAEQATNPPTPVPAPPVEKPKPQPIVVPAGTTLTVRVEQALSSKDSQAGQTFLATLAQPVSVSGKTAIPADSSVSGTVVSAKEKGKIKGEGELALSLTSITLHGRNHAIQTGVLDSTVKGKGKRTAKTTGGGAAGGALIGGLAGGGKGAGIGALVGAGAGLVGGAMTGNKQVEIPAESALTFTLIAPLTLPPPAE